LRRQIGHAKKKAHSNEMRLDSSFWMRVMGVLTGLSFFVILYLLFKCSYFADNFLNDFVQIFVGALAATIALYWYGKNYEQKEREQRGALSLSISRGDVVILQNNGGSIVEGIEIHAITREYSRNEANPVSLNERYEDLKKALQRSIGIASDEYKIGWQKQMTISKGEAVNLVLRNGLKGPIEEKELLVRIICVRYMTSSGQKYIRFVGTYRLTGLANWLLYEVCQRYGVHYNSFLKYVANEGLYFASAGDYARILHRLLAEKDSKVGFLKNINKDKVTFTLEDFADREQIDIGGLREDEFYIFKIEEDKDGKD
jgi:hypothetical protein